VSGIIIMHVYQSWSHDFPTALNADHHSSVPLSVQRTLRGSSQARGQLSIVITNNWLTELHVIYLETMPWLLQFYLHTLRIHSDDDVPCGAQTGFFGPL
jgi:phosphatidylinositol glycan class T